MNLISKSLHKNEKKSRLSFLDLSCFFDNNSLNAKNAFAGNQHLDLFFAFFFALYGFYFFHNYIKYTFSNTTYAISGISFFIGRPAFFQAKKELNLV